MRRRRPQLQVSLFPFLSVLLCSLGALILLLLVLDQKARESRAAEIARQQSAERQVISERFARARAELEAEVQERRRTLEAGRDDLQLQAGALRKRETELLSALNKRRQELNALERLLADEQTRVAAQEAEVTRREQTSDRHGRADEERRRLLAQLRELEAVIERLQDAQRRRPPVYSLVPYKGKQGTHRQPLYLECVGNELIFRPGDMRLRLEEVHAPGRLQSELEQRFSGLTESENKHRPYVLLLIRPSAIELYYAVLRSLQKSKIDVGYEFIDEDWRLNLGSDPRSAVGHRPEQAGGQGPGDARTPAADRRLPGVGSGTGGGAPRGGDEGQSAGGADARIGAPGLAGRGRSTLLPTMPTRTNDASETTRDSPPTAGRQLAGGGSSQPEAGDRTASGGPSGKTRSPEAGGRAAEQPRHAGSGEHEASDALAPQRGPPGMARPTPVGGTASSEWTLHVECNRDGVSLVNFEHTFTLAELQGKDNALKRFVQDQLQRKRQRNPDLRARVKFIIHADALRTYYAAAGAIDQLRLPMNWEWVKEAQP
jgi:hypothetical protein